MNQYENESCRDALAKNTKLLKLFEGNEIAVSNVLDEATPTGYTYHGKEHIAMVEQYVGRLLGEKRIAKLTDDEIFILLMGVLCHDVGMIKYKTEGEIYVTERENHNIASYLMVYDQPNNKRGDLEINVPSQNPKYYKAIAELCLGHRDHKNLQKQTIHTLSEPCKIQGCDDIVIRDPIFLSSNNQIHVEYLAAILRLADEIDVTNQRAPRDVERHIRTFITDVAKKHWCSHQLIDHVEIKPDQNKNGVITIYLIPDKDEIKARSKDPVDGLDIDMLLSLVYERLEKIKDEIRIINHITGSSCYYNTGLSVEYDVTIKWDEIVTEEKYNDYVKRVAEELGKKKRNEDRTGADYEENKGVAQTPKKTPRERFNEEIQRLKTDQNLLEISNYEFPFGDFSYYFINTQLLLTNSNILNMITDIFEDHYSSIDIDIIIGVGKAGIILAPNLSLKLKCNSSYLIGEWESLSSTTFEKSSSLIETTKNVLILLDVFSTGTATKLCIEEIKKKNYNLESIYIGAIFCTDIEKKKAFEKNNNVREIFSINDDFQFRTYTQNDAEDEKDFKKVRKEFELLPLRKK